MPRSRTVPCSAPAACGRGLRRGGQQREGADGPPASARCTCLSTAAASALARLVAGTSDRDAVLARRIVEPVVAPGRAVAFSHANRLQEASIGHRPRLGGHPSLPLTADGPARAADVRLRRGHPPPRPAVIAATQRTGDRAPPAEQPSPSAHRSRNARSRTSEAAQRTAPAGRESRRPARGSICRTRSGRCAAR